MTAATGHFGITSLSRPIIQAEDSASTFRRRMLSDEPKPLDFALTFATEEREERLGVRLIGSGSEPSSLWRVFRAFRELAALPANWDSYGAQPLAASAVRRSFNLLPLLLTDTSREPAIVPTRDGGVQFEWHRGGIDVELKVPGSGPLSYLIADANAGTELEGEGSLNIPAIREAIERIAQVA